MMNIDNNFLAIATLAKALCSTIDFAKTSMGGGREPNLEPKSPQEPQNSDFCFCFDIDDTLIHTNLANFLSYQKAICEVKSIEIRPILLQNRCDKNLLANFSLNDGESKRIKSLKDKYFTTFYVQQKSTLFYIH